MKIVALVKRGAACDYHRIQLPMQFLKKDEKDSYLFAFEDSVLRGSDLHDAHIVYFNRTSPFDLARLCSMRSQYGFKIIVDVDDYWEIYQHHIVAREWNKEKMTERIKEALNIADMVFCTNDRLASQVCSINENVHILPNSVPFGADQFTPALPSRYERVRFIYAGGRSHYFDLKTIDSVFKKCRSDFDMNNKATFVIAGYDSKDEYWKKVYNLIHQAGNNVEVKANRPLTSYMKVYDECDVVLAPLEDNKFNTYKSTLKLVEAGCKKLPLIASKIWPYLEDEEMDGKGMILCESPSEFLDAMRFFVRNPQKVKEMGQNLYEYVVRKYNLHLVNEKRHEHIKSLLTT